MKLLDETIEYLDGKDIDPEKEVKWVGSRDGKYAMSFADFAKKFATLVYDNDYGRQEIAKDLVVVGDGWWLERAEYDGSEWWELKQPPILSSAPKKFKCVRGDGLESMLDDLNEDGDDTKEPLIKDEKIRQIIKAWAEVNEVESVFITVVKDAEWGCLYWELASIEWEQSITIRFGGELPDTLKDMTIYTVEELCDRSFGKEAE